MADPRLEDVLAGIATGRPDPTDDGIDHQPDGYSQAELDRLADEQADLDHDRRTR